MTKALPIRQAVVASEANNYNLYQMDYYNLAGTNNNWYLNQFPGVRGARSSTYGAMQGLFRTPELTWHSTDAYRTITGTEWFKPAECYEWATWAGRYYYYRVVKIIHEWAWNEYSLADEQASYPIEIIVQPRQGTRRWDYFTFKDDWYKPTSLMREGSRAYKLHKGKKVRVVCKPAEVVDVNANDDLTETHTQWYPCSKATTRERYGINWIAHADIQVETQNDNPKLWHYGTSTLLPTDTDTVVYRRWAIIQFASEIDTHGGHNNPQ